MPGEGHIEYITGIDITYILLWKNILYDTVHIFLKPPQLGHLSRNESRTGIMIFPHQHNTGANDCSMYHICFHGEALRPTGSTSGWNGGSLGSDHGKIGLANKDRRGVGICGFSGSSYLWLTALDATSR